MNYHNPIIPGFYPDPSIVRVEDDYYLVNSSFEYAPSVPLFHSKDLINWTQISHVLDRPSQVELKDAFCSGGIYAPTIRWHQGVFYMITTCLTKKKLQNFFVTTTDPTTGFSDPIEVSFQGIDPSLYFEEDRVYAQYASADETGRKCIKQVELDGKTGALLSKEQILTYGTGGRDVEGPHLYHHKGYYFLLTAEGGTREGHMITIHRSQHLWGPYETYERNPILTNRDRGDLALQGIGHGDFVEDTSGNWWMVCLGYRQVKHRHVTGRETMLVKIDWSEDLWPIVKDGVLQTEYPILSDTIQQPRADVHERFTSDKLSLDWIMLRDPQAIHYEIKPHCFTLFGNSDSLDTLGSPAFVAMRQRDLCCCWKTEISVKGIETGEAGIALYMDPNHHMELGIHKKEDGTYAFVRKTVGELQVITKELKLKQDQIQLRIRADRMSYAFDVMQQELDWTYAKHLSTEVADAQFNGVVCGMYVRKELEYACFHSFDYEQGKE